MTAAKAKQDLNLLLQGTDHDEKLTRQIAAATSQYQADTDSVVITANFQQQAHDFPRDDEYISIKTGPVQTITSIKYFDEDGAEQTLDPGKYTLNNASRTVALLPGETWPTTDQRHYGVSVDYVAGYGDAANVDELIQQAILCLVAAFFYGNSPDAQAYMNCYERLIANQKRTTYV